MLNWIFIVLAHWNNRPWVDISPHSDTLSRFWANQSLLFLVIAACLAEKQKKNTNFIVFGLTRSGVEPMIYRTQEWTLTITPPMRFNFLLVMMNYSMFPLRHIYFNCNYIPYFMGCNTFVVVIETFSVGL
jgi:hypothetical protein